MNDLDIKTKNTMCEAKKVKLYFFIALAVSGVAVILRTLSLLFFYDGELAYYSRGAVLPVISNIFYGMAVVFFLIAAYLLIKPKCSVPAPSRRECFTAIIPAVFAAVYAVDILLGIITDKTDAPIDKMVLISAVLALVAAAFFFTVAFSKTFNIVTVILGVGFVFWCGITWIMSYMDLYVPINSPDKLFFHFGLVGAALFVSSELRTMFDISKPKFYYFTLFFSILTLGVASIPTIIGNLSGVFDIYECGYESLILFGILLCAICRGIITVIQKPKEISDAEQKDTQE